MIYWIVFGAEVEELGTAKVKIKLETQHFVGLYEIYQEAFDEWKANSQKTVDNALMRYFIRSVELDS